jgi:serine phosphatase RsbU (regulator of sigma subunit)/PAS domain-containing protein
VRKGQAVALSDGAELGFDAEPDVVPRARRLARSTVEASRPDLLDDTELVVSELVTNATLHGRPPFTLRVRVGEGVRIEVEDAGAHLPVLLPAETASTTWRGLSLVAAVATRWGVDALAGGGKRVWAELDPRADAGGDGQGRPAEPSGTPEPGAADEAPTPVLRLGPVPTELLLDAERHVEGVTRELSLLGDVRNRGEGTDRGEGTGGDGAGRGGSERDQLVALIEPLGTDFADAHRQVRRLAARAAAAGDPVTDLVLRLPIELAEEGQRHLAALDEADRLARASRLLTLAAPPAQRVLRDWWVGAAVAALRSHKERTPPPPVRPFAAVLAEQLDRLSAAADAAARLELVGTVARSLASANTVDEMAGVVVDHAVSALGVRSARVRVLTAQRTLRTVAWAGEAVASLASSAGDIPLDSDLPGAEVARTGRARSVRSLRDAVGSFAGDEIPLDVSARIFPLVADGVVLGILSLTFRPGELTDRAELGLAESLASLLARSLRAAARDRIARVMDTWATAFLLLDPNWRIAYLNVEAERLLGRRANQLVGQVLWEAFPAAVGSEFERWYRLAADSGEAVAFEAYYPEPLNAWYEVRAWPGPDGLAVHFLDITARRQAEATATSAISRVGLLARVTEELAAAPDAPAAMSTLAKLVAPTLADWCVVTLLDEDPGAVRRAPAAAFGWHADPESRELVSRYVEARLASLSDGALVAGVIDSGEPRVIQGGALRTVLEAFEPGGEAATLMVRLAPDSVALLPLLGRHRPFGVLSVGNGVERGPFSDVDLELLRDVAARAGVALDRARLYRQQQQVTEALQRSMLTPTPTDGPSMAVRYVPAGQVAQVGGDWYDAFDHPDGSRVVIIGDVVGHDSMAAAAMGQIRTLLRTVIARHGPSPAAALAEAEAVMDTLGYETLATVAVGRIEVRSDGDARLVLANAGHPPPVLVAADGTVSDLADGPADVLLGVGGPTRTDREVDLAPGSTLVFYTDGLVERRDRAIEEGRRQLADLLAAHATADVEALCDVVVETMVGSGAEDDVALIALRLPSGGEKGAISPA